MQGPHQLSPFALVLLDYQMPGMDGLRVAQDIRKRAEFGTATILMLKSGGAPGEAREARRAGIATCLFKPFKQSELLAAILKALNKAVPADAGHGTGTPLGVEGTSQPLRILASAQMRRILASCGESKNSPASVDAMSSVAARRFGMSASAMRPISPYLKAPRLVGRITGTG